MQDLENRAEAAVLDRKCMMRWILIWCGGAECPAFNKPNESYEIQSQTSIHGCRAGFHRIDLTEHKPSGNQRAIEQTRAHSHLGILDGLEGIVGLLHVEGLVLQVRELRLVAVMHCHENKEERTSMQTRANDS
jgi:hypothetical protein